MAKFNKFEEIESWKKARTVTKEIYRITLVSAFARDFGLRDQMRRASVSILSNIAEGFEREGDREFLRFLAIAKGSSGELRSQLYVALDQNYITSERFDFLFSEVTQTSQLISGFMKYLRRTVRTK